jgi:hypothetical protein
MATDSSESNGNDNRPRDAAYWAQQGQRLKVGELPKGAVNINVEGRSVTSPLQGFGPMWQKTYRVRLDGTNVTPVEVIAAWKANFPKFWPKGNRFYVPITGIQPGEVAVLNLKTGGMPLSTGVLVLYADDESFTLMTPEGHMFAGWITFNSYAESERTVAQAQVLMRASDPMYELGLRLGGHRAEDKFWVHTLTEVAAYFGVTAPVEKEVICIDRRLQWRQAGNLRNNAAMRTVLTAPTRWFRRGSRA